eukprot:TRINITY_DN2512_c0_g1_i8.p1 TRINITY_DN2512_c0_g1~~TRINITY_DN2512_c0_g1_i8.p1  ORF type:complete len:342 (+),score=88.31 TRINITY_DN2512_c0_g1_i8:139-1164(+)
MVEGKYIWQDKEIRFDCKLSYLQLRKNEVTVDSMNAIEDTKGNNGEKGNMVITNLRVIWFKDADQSINLSIGYDCITGVEIKNVESRLKGNCQALYIKTKFSQNRYEFIFTSLISNSPRLFTSFQAVVRSYETTKVYREIRVRSAIIQEKLLTLLPEEHVYNKYSNVYSISTDQQTSGILVVTNVRIVWYALTNDNFNVSIPWIQISRVKVRDSTYGKAIIIETYPNNNGHMSGFKLDGIEKIFAELSNLLKVHSESPIFGIESVVEEKFMEGRMSAVPRIADDVQIVNVDYYKGSSNAVYSYMTQNNKEDRPVVFSKELGLAIEQPPEGVSVEELWKVIA